MSETQNTQYGVFGTPPHGLVDVPSTAQQFSPLVPGAAPLAECHEAILAGMAVLAPPGTIERRRTLALALRALKPGCELTALAPKGKGGARIAKELVSFGLDVDETSKRHYRIVSCVRPPALPDMEATIQEGAMRRHELTGLWTQPGIFSWDRIDPGTELLLQRLPALSGRGADLGAGNGVLARAILSSASVTAITLIEIDGRAIQAARHNVSDERAEFRWADIRSRDAALNGLDFVVMNAPFHDGGLEDRSLVGTFVSAAARSLKSGGRLWMVGNRHLPYEAELAKNFSNVQSAATARGYKVYEAVK